MADNRKTLNVVNVDGGKGPSGLANHWALAPIYRDVDTGETWHVPEDCKSVPPDLAVKLVRSGAWQKIGEIEVQDARSGAGPEAKQRWKEQSPRKPQGPSPSKKAAS